MKGCRQDTGVSAATDTAEIGVLILYRHSDWKPVEFA